MALINAGDASTLYTVRVGAGEPRSVDLDPNRGYDSDDHEFDPAWSPDGKSISFVDTVFPGVGLFLIRPDGGARRQLTQKLAHNPSWSPDSRRIVFDDGHDIDVINADGSGLRSLMSTSAKETDPSWSPDGREIAFVRGKSIWVMDASGRHARRVIKSGSQPAWKGR
jgi:Tol biopolymer transport system component